MNLNKSLVVSISCLFFSLLLIAPAVEARNPYRKTFFQVYPSAEGSVLDDVASHSGHCGVCHYDFGGSGPKNPYGDAVAATDKSEAAILGLGSLDSDGDGKSNDVEITDTVNYNNTPTFPGLTPTNIGSVVNVLPDELSDHLVPLSGNDTTGPVVSVVYPNGGETFIGNNGVTVQWTASDENGVAGVDVFLSLDNGATWKTLALGLNNTGSFTWFAANRPTTQALIKIKALDNASNVGEDVSDAVFSVVSPVGGLVPTTLRDFDMPGSQPFEAGTLTDPVVCAQCHGDYDASVEPYANWQGSMMAHASIDPIYLANQTIANQDAPDSGDLCLRCHYPRGWLQGRSIPTDGSAMADEDFRGVSCDLCHRMVDPIADVTNPIEDTAILAGLSMPTSWFGNGMYTVDPIGGRRRGPFDDALDVHPVITSSFHSEAAFCGTCHDVSNPAFEWNETEQKYLPNALDAMATDFDPTVLLPVERTYSEWLNSSYNSPEGIYAPQLGGNKAFVSTCQDCHMRDVTGVGCNDQQASTRTDLPLHDMTGGSAWVTETLAALYPDKVDPAAAAAGAARSRELMANAAEITMEQIGNDLVVTVVNNTGHKLPTGYPEGRRMWINVKFFDEASSLVAESAAYDPSTGVLDHHDDAKIYEIEPGLSSEVAGITGLPVGKSFHFALNNIVVKDNRIPPRGFTNSNFATFGGQPVGYTYADEQYWDETEYTVPAGAVSVEVKLYYQSTSKEFIEFLRDENTTNTLGQEIYDLWENNGKCPPELITSGTLSVTAPIAGDFNEDHKVDEVDLVIISSAWLTGDGDAGWNEACDIYSPEDDFIDVKDFSVFAANWQVGTL